MKPAFLARKTALPSALILALAIGRNEPTMGPIPCLCAGQGYPDLVTCPAGDFDYQVLVVDCDCDPLPGVIVELRISAAMNDRLCWCEGGDTPSSGTKGAHEVLTFTTIADPNSIAHFRIAAGGCAGHRQSLGERVEMFWATQPGGPFEKLTEVGAISFDAVDPSGLLPADPSYAPGACEVGVSDGVHLTPAFQGGAYARCADFSGDAWVGLADVVLFTPHASGAHRCPGS